MHSLEYRFRRKDGSYCWVSDEQRLLKDKIGKPLEIVGSRSDVTARKEAEAVTEAARARLSQLISAAPAVIYSFKATGDFGPTFVSENIRRVLGYDPGEYLANPIFGESGCIRTTSRGSKPKSHACSGTACIPWSTAFAAWTVPIAGSMTSSV